MDDASLGMACDTLAQRSPKLDPQYQLGSSSHSWRQLVCPKKAPESEVRHWEDPIREYTVFKLLRQRRSIKNKACGDTYYLMDPVGSEAHMPMVRKASKSTGLRRIKSGK